MILLLRARACARSRANPPRSSPPLPASFNKFLYIGPFRFPLTLTAVHMLFATVGTQALMRAGRLVVPQLGWPFYARNIVPLGLMFAGSLSTSNLAAMRLSVSFIQMIKAVTPMTTLAVAVSYGTEKPYRSLLVITTMMTLGVGLASLGEIEFDLLGMLLQLAALTIESVRLVAIQRMVQQHLPRGNPLASLALFAPVCFLFLLPVALLFEPLALGTLWASPRAVGVPVLFSALLAFGLNAAVVLLVSHESGPLTLTLAGIIKDIALIVSSIYLFSNPITYTQVAGYTLALYGLNCYHRFKSGHAGPPDGPLWPLLRVAATDRTMMVMGAGLACLLLFARAA